MSQIKIGVIGGSGMGTALNDGSVQTLRHESIETPFGKPSDAIVETNWSGVPVFLLSRHGPGHLLGPSQVPYRANIFALKQLGCTHVIATGAVGSLRQEYAPRDLVIVDQLIDRTSRRESSFFDRGAAVHIEFAEPFCRTLRQILIEAAIVPRAGDAPSDPSVPKVHERGCYVCIEGPSFSTRAESLMHRLLGGDLVGMTALPEARLAREAEMSYALVALVTDYDSWRAVAAPTDPKPDADSLLKEIIANLDAASKSGIDLIRRAVAAIATRSAEQLDSPAHRALALGIWSDKSKISEDDVKRLAPLWMQYFGDNPKQD